VRTAAVPIVFSGLVASTTVGALITTSITKKFNFGSFSPDIAGQTIYNALFANYEATGVQIFAQAIGYGGACAIAIPGLQLAGAAIIITGTVITHAAAVPQYGRLLLMCTVDVLLIMERVFWMHEKNITADHVEDACEYYKNNKVVEVHAAVKEILPVWGVFGAFQYDKLREGLKDIIRVHRFKKDI